MRKRVWVKPYRRSDGTHVQGYWRYVESKPSFDFKLDESLFKQNINKSQGNSKAQEIPEIKPRSEKEVLIEKYKSQVREIEKTIKLHDFNIEKGERYIRDPEKYKKEFNRDAILGCSMLSILAVGFLYQLNLRLHKIGGDVKRLKVAYGWADENRDHRKCRVSGKKYEKRSHGLSERTLTGAVVD
jgi:hypothetical protein